MTQSNASGLGPALKRHGISRASVAVQLGVSLQTVHNWCSGRVRIPVERTRELADVLADSGMPPVEVEGLVRAAATARGMDPALLRERGSRGREARPVMIAVWDMKSSSTFGEVSRLCRSALEGMGYQVQVVDCGGEHRVKRQAIRQAASMGYRGVVMAGLTGEMPDPVDDLLSSIQEAVDHGLPTVTVQPWSLSLDLPRGAAGIGWDANVATTRAVDLLLDAGHEKVGALMGTGGGLYGARQRGMQIALAERGLSLTGDALVWPSEHPDDADDMVRLLREATGVFVPPSELLHVARVCHEQSLLWPEDVSLVTVGHPQVIPQLGRRPFTYVTVPLGKVSRGAAHLMDAMVQGEEYGQEFVLFGASSMPVENLERGSIGPALEPSWEVTYPASAGRS